MKKGHYLIGLGLIALSLWVSKNALEQSRVVRPGESASQAVGSLLFGGPVLRRVYCPEDVHAGYYAQGSDGRQYPTWHPPVDAQNGCYFDHEHGSDPHSYLGFEESGLPVFGFSASRTGLQETHPGYKVFVANNDLNGHAWMILLHQDTASPERALARYHTLDWHISDFDGKTLVDMHLLADFGYAAANCGKHEVIPASLESLGDEKPRVMKRLLPTDECAGQNSYEIWNTRINLAGVFKARPAFGVDNPITAIDPASPLTLKRMCEFQPEDENCTSTVDEWRGSQRTIIRAGQWVDNEGPEFFLTNAYGRKAEPGDPGAIRQYVTRQGWDNTDPQEGGRIFRIQTFSQGVFVADPEENAGSAEFGYGLP